jgi:hypothetical protein
MFRRRALCWAAVLVLGVAVGIPLGHILPKYADAKARYNRIRPGMTLDEARAILGPPGRFGWGSEGSYCWSDGWNTITVEFSPADWTVTRKELIDQIDCSCLGWVRHRP